LLLKDFFLPYTIKTVFKNTEKFTWHYSEPPPPWESRITYLNVLFPGMMWRDGKLRDVIYVRPLNSIQFCKLFLKPFSQLFCFQRYLYYFNPSFSLWYLTVEGNLKISIGVFYFLDCGKSCPFKTNFPFPFPYTKMILFWISGIFDKFGMTS